MSEPPRVPRDKFADDPLVPISGRRLAAALELRGISVNQAGKYPGLKQQTVSYIVNGRTKRCRSSRRRHLADVVQVSEAWLAGDDVVPIEGFPFGLSSPPEELWRPHRTDENIRRRAVDSAELPPAYQLHWTHLTDQILKAWKRDIDAGVQGAAELKEAMPGDFSGEAWPRVSLLLHRALGITWWRLRLLAAAPVPDPPENLAARSAKEVKELTLAIARQTAAAEVSREHEDDFATAGARAIETMLLPWIEGDKALNYRAVSVALGWIRAGMLLDGIPNLGGPDQEPQPS